MLRTGRRRRGVAPLEVVMTTALVIPSLFALLYLGFRVMATYMAIIGTMIGSPLF